MPIVAIAAMFSACDESVDLPKWNYVDDLQAENNGNGSGNNSGNSDDPGIQDKPDEIETVWFRIDKHTHFTLEEYMDSLLAMYPEFEAQKGFLTINTSKTLELDAYSFTYNSQDVNGVEDEVSALLVVPSDNGKVDPTKRLIVDNHTTQTSEALMPSKSLAITEVLALLGNPVVAPDLIGYGASSDKTKSFCCRHTAARNTVDAIMAAQCIMNSGQISTKLTKTMPVVSIGYSQGGYDALALLRYMETEATETEKSQISIQKTYCGAGPYDLSIFQDEIFKHTTYLYSPFVLLSLQSMHFYHPEVIGRYSVNDFITQKVIDFQVPQAVQSGLMDPATLIGWNFQNLGLNLADFFSADIVDHSTELSKTFIKVAETESVLTNWTPKGSLYFYHHEQDDCVPVACTKAAEEAFKNVVSATFFYDKTPMPSNVVHTDAGALFYTKVIMEMLGF